MFETCHELSFNMEQIVITHVSYTEKNKLYDVSPFNASIENGRSYCVKFTNTNNKNA